jgi:hypothetical protein
VDVRILGALAAFALSSVVAAPARGIAVNPTAIDRPDGQGDQLIFYYDARADFTTFLNLHNDGAADRDVEVLFYNPTFSSPVIRRTYSIDGGGTKVVDVGALKSEEPALPAQFGVAIATAIDNHGHPIVTHVLSGNFTVANLQLRSAWGAPAGARSAITLGEGGPPDVGDEIDGTTVVLPPIQPTSAHLAVYYNPATLAPAAASGNQLIFVAFEDVPGEIYSAQVSVTSWGITATRGNGATIDVAGPFVASGVTVTDLLSVVGPDADGSSGSLTFDASVSADPLNRLVFFTETLGTFATGYLLPPATHAPL